MSSVESPILDGTDPGPTESKSSVDIATVHPEAHSPSPVVRVTSSTYHLSQVALRELKRRIRLELPDFQQENLLVELGSYGAFDVRIGNMLVCEVSKTVLYPPVSSIISQLANAMLNRAIGERLLTLHRQHLLADEVAWAEFADSEGGSDRSSTRSSSSSVNSQDYCRAMTDDQSVMSPDGVPVGEELVFGGGFDTDDPEDPLPLPLR